MSGNNTLTRQDQTSDQKLERDQNPEDGLRRYKDQFRLVCQCLTEIKPWTPKPDRKTKHSLFVRRNWMILMRTRGLHWCASRDRARRRLTATCGNTTCSLRQITSRMRMASDKLCKRQKCYEHITSDTQDVQSSTSDSATRPWEISLWRHCCSGSHICASYFYMESSIAVKIWSDCTRFC